MIPNGLLCHPAVFAVEEDYQILMLSDKPVLLSVLVDGKEYFDDACGVRRSDTETHRVTVPQAALDAVGCYTLRVCEVIERKPYWPDIADPQDYTYTFHPLTKTDDIALYHIADVHGRAQHAIAAVKAAARQPDVLLFNGDLPDHCGNFTEMHTLLNIASAVSGGTLPCVCARGNHDFRGCYAEHYVDYLPTKHGLTYYTFRVGCLWGVVLDCGEDKPDNSSEYGGTICCHSFREKQTEFLRKVSGWDAPGIQYRLVLCHNPFTQTPVEPFNIEIPLFTEWAELLKENVKPHLMICGHTHTLEVREEGSERDHKGQPCPIVIASLPKEIGYTGAEYNGYTGATITLKGDTADVVCNDNTGAQGFTVTVPLKRW